jgi:acyl-CoA thioesterase-1
MCKNANGRCNSLMRIVVTICFMVFCALVNACSREDVSANVANAGPSPVPSPTSMDPNKARIIAFGDSLTSGFGLADTSKSYPSLLQASLDRDGFNYDVVNLGLPGDTSDGGLKRLWLALKYANVKVFIVELGANDIVRKTPVPDIKANLAEIIRQVEANGAKIVLCGYEAPKNLGDQYASEVREMYASLAKENDLRLIPNFMQDVNGNPERMQEDGIHPNEKGAAVIEQNVRPVVETVVGKNDGKQESKKR